MNFISIPKLLHKEVAIVPLTPLDIHNKEFTRGLRGYDQDEVNDFLDQIIKDFEIVIRENGFQRSEFFIYDNNDLLLEKRISSEDSESYTVRKYDYDFYGNLTREEGDWNNAEFQYTYDGYGNWTERLEIKESIVFCKTTREIKYYE